VKPSALEFFQVLSSGEFEEGKENGERRMQAHTFKKPMRQQLVDQDYGKKWVSQIDQLSNTCCIKEDNLKFTKGSR
jgi:hypothetical protein